MLQARQITVRIGASTLLEDVDVDVSPGEVVSVLGPNGAGKSTLLGVVLGQMEFDGDIRIGGRDLDDWPIARLAQRRAVLAQSVRVPFGFRVDETVRLGTMPWSTTSGLSPGECVRRCLESVGMEAFAGRQMSTLSGGEQRRVHLARVLAQLEWPTEDVRGRLLLLDEPLSSLDIAESARVLSLVGELRRAGVAVMCVLHDLSSAALVSDRVLLLRGGQTVAAGRTADVMTPEVLTTCFGTPVDVTASTDGHPLIHSRTSPAT